MKDSLGTNDEISIVVVRGNGEKIENISSNDFLNRFRIFLNKFGSVLSAFE